MPPPGRRMQLESPYKISRSYAQHLNAPPADVFPLLCPVRELEWVEGWDPGVVITDSGIAELGCVFTTRAGDAEAIWTITEYEPDDGRIAFLKVTPGQTVADISVKLEPDGDGKSVAHVTYAHTALGPGGRSIVDEFTEAHFDAFMQGWEAALNAYLARQGS